MQDKEKRKKSKEHKKKNENKIARTIYSDYISM